MPDLADNVSHWIGRVELLARGADDDLRAAQQATLRGNPIVARAHCLALLSKAPTSPIGLAMLVDISETLGLLDDATEGMRKLCELAPWRGELWVRLGDLLVRSNALAEAKDAFQHALAPDMDSEARRKALLLLTDIDLAAGDPWRASRWLDSLCLFRSSPEVSLRRLEVGLATGDRGLVESSLAELPDPSPIDGRSSLAIGRGRYEKGDAFAIDLIVRGYILEVAGASEALAFCISKSTDAVEVARLRALLRADNRHNEPAFLHAFALAEGRQGDAQDALLQIAKGGDLKAASTLYVTALQRGDLAAVRAAIEAMGDTAPSEAKQVQRACLALDEGESLSALEILDGLTQTSVQLHALAQALRVQAFAKVLGKGEGTDAGLIELRRAAAAFDRMDLAFEAEDLAVERSRPLRVAVVGEFNAGKSTFINALLGADVAPTGVLPTTATLHWLSWAQDSFARIVLQDGVERIVGHDLLKKTLREITDSGLPLPREVHICAPIERLKRIEVLDTPGFNAPDADHIAAATRALAHAHVVLWLMDGAQALKDSEREILQRICSAGTPIQVLINKLDRLSKQQAESIAEHVRAGLTESGIESIGPVLVFSARQALSGRIGDSEMLERSGWGQVEQVLSEYIVGRCDVLRRAAIRRKTASLARRLLADLPGIGGTASDDTQRRRLASAERLLQLDLNYYRGLAGWLEKGLALIDDDLRPLSIAGISSEDPQAKSYFQARVVARLSEPLLQSFFEASGLSDDITDRRRELLSLRAVLRGASSVVGKWADARLVASVPVLHACALAVAEALRESLPVSAHSVERELRRYRLLALCEAIEAGLPSRSSSCRYVA